MSITTLRVDRPEREATLVGQNSLPGLDGKYILREDEIVAGALPYQPLCGVYFLVHESRVVYVGQSINVLLRVQDHKKSGKTFDSYAFIRCPQEYLDVVESLYMHLLRPELNHSLKQGDLAVPLQLGELLQTLHSSSDGSI